MFALPYLTGALSKLRVRIVDHPSVSNAAQKISTRPPNVLIYTGGKSDVTTAEGAFKKAKDLVSRCLDQDKYVIYQLADESISRQPWQENTELLILASGRASNVEKSHENAFESYVRHGGKLLNFSELVLFADVVGRGELSPPENEICMYENGSSKERCVSVPDVHTYFKVNPDEKIEVLAVTLKTSQPVIVRVSHDNGLAILSTAALINPAAAAQDERAEKNVEDMLKMLLRPLGMTCGHTQRSSLTPAILLADARKKEIVLRSVRGVLNDSCFHGNNIKIVFTDDVNSIATIDSFPVVTHSTCEPSDVAFSLPRYKEILKTKHLGQTIIYTDVITSTQTIMNGSMRLVREIPYGHGLAVIAGQQTIGKGRGGNTWLSPDGCLSFSFPLEVDLDTNLGQRLPFVQHLSALAVVDAARGSRGYQDIDLRIKWPNDIYLGRDTKMGGILVNSTVHGKRLYAIIGIGVNLDNSEPTTCINDIIKRQNDPSLEKISKEELLAGIFNEMESLVEDFQAHGPERFLKKYYSRWLHSDAQVRLGDMEGEMVVIKGLDDMGFLSVVNSLSEVKTVQPDGNSFDMMRNLITVKTRES